MAKENQTRHAILGLLVHEPLSGYDIKKRIETSLSYFWNAGFGQIYPALKQLEEDKLVEKKIEASENRPSRKVYTILDAGKEELQRWLAAPPAKENVKYEMLLKLFFGSQIPVSDTIKNIEEFGARSLAGLDVLNQFENQLRAILPESKDHTYYLLTVLFGKHIHNAYLAWADEAVKVLQGQKQEA